MQVQTQINGFGLCVGVSVGGILFWFLGDEGEALPPPDDFAVFFAEPEYFADGFGGIVDQVEDAFAIFRRGGGGFEVPIQVGLLEGFDE